MSVSELVRKPVREIEAYTLEQRALPVKLDQNESPFDLPRDLKERIASRLLDRSWNRYPSFGQTRLRERLAATYGLDSDQVLVGNGSNELLVAVMLTFVDSAATVIVARPSFSLYEHYARALGASIEGVAVDLESGLLPVDGMVDAARRSSGRVVIFVCSPNNPSGSVLGGNGLDRLLETGAVVVLDRAYGEFSEDSLPRPADGLIVLSTFSKAWGLAGLRIGWLVSTAETVREIAKMKLPYNVNIASEEIALTALENRSRLLTRIAEVVAERERIAEGIRRIGAEVFPSEANFLLFRVSDSRRVFESLIGRGILVRDVSSAPGLRNCLRVSIGCRQDNDAFLGALAQAECRSEHLEVTA